MRLRNTCTVRVLSAVHHLILWLPACLPNTHQAKLESDPHIVAFMVEPIQVGCGALGGLTSAFKGRPQALHAGVRGKE